MKSELSEKLNCSAVEDLVVVKLHGHAATTFWHEFFIVLETAGSDVDIENERQDVLIKLALIVIF